MKIGIITYQGAHNYGAMLQAHAVQEVLAELGHCPVFINFLPPALERANRKKIPVRNLKSLVLNLALLPFRGKLGKRYRRFEEFRAKRLITTRHYARYEEIEADPPEVDCYLVGSDQVWNMEEGGYPVFFLRFLGEDQGKVPVIAYAPSFGTAEIPGDYEERFTEWAQVYDFLSVRESSGRILAERLLGKPVVQVLDPVFLKSADYWRNLAGSRLRKGPYIAFYSLEASGRVSDCLLKIARELKLPVVVLGKPGPFMLHCRAVVAIDAGPLEFLSWLAHAEFVVTNSFHATAFSAIFQVPYAVVAHSSRNARMESLLEILNQEDRIIQGTDDLTAESLEVLRKEPQALESDESGRFPADLGISRAFLAESLKSAEGGGCDRSGGVKQA